MGITNNLSLYQNWINPLAKSRHKLFGMQSKIGISKTKYKSSDVIPQLQIQVVLTVLVCYYKKNEKDLLLFACRHHIYELALRSVFDAKIHQVTTGPNILLFKKFKEQWKNIDHRKIQCCKEIIKPHFNTSEIYALLKFYRVILKENIARDDYRELLELSIIFLGGNADLKLKIRPPGAMHQARWMARKIYSLKILLLSSQFKMTNEDMVALQDVCLFIVTSYVKPWCQCSSAVKAPYQDLRFLKSLK